MNSPLIARDSMMPTLAEIAREFSAMARRQTMMAMAATGGRLRNAVGLTGECLRSVLSGGRR